MKQGHASGLIATHLPACFAPLLQRVRERQAEVAEERRALAAEKRAREEEARRDPLTLINKGEYLLLAAEALGGPALQAMGAGPDATTGAAGRVAERLHGASRVIGLLGEQLQLPIGVADAGHDSRGNAPVRRQLRQDLVDVGRVEIAQLALQTRKLRSKPV
mgnify:CR=1 FL=1